MKKAKIYCDKCDNSRSSKKSSFEHKCKGHKSSKPTQPQGCMKYWKICIGQSDLTKHMNSHAPHVLHDFCGFI